MMKTFKSLLLSLVMLGIAFVLYAPGTLAAAFGVSPPYVTNDNLKPGSDFVHVIDLSTNDPARDMMVRTEVAGDPEILEWITVRDADNLTMPKGEQHVPMYVDLKVPETAETGNYKGSISITVKPKEKGNEQIAIFLGGHISIDLDVVDFDVTDYWVKSVSVQPITEGQSVRLNMMVKNLGNTPLSNIKTTVEIADHRTGELVATGETDHLTSLVYPHTFKEVQLSYSNPKLEAGNYWVTVNAFKGGQSVYQNRLYLTVASPDVNNVLKTSVNVGDELLKPASFEGNDVRLETSVKVRAPFTNQLIGIVIVLLGVLIILAARLQAKLTKRRRR